MESPKKAQKLGKKLELTDRMMRSLIQNSSSGNFSALELTSIANNEFKLSSRFRIMQQIIAATPYMMYLKMLKAPRMSREKKKTA